MMRQRTWLAVLAALLGAVAVWWLFPQHDRAADLGQFRLSREAAISKAREVARLNGVDTAGWWSAVQAENWRGGAWIYLWRRLHPESRVFSSLVTPYVVRVSLRQPGDERTVEVTFASDGRVVGFSALSRVADGVGHVHASETLDALADGTRAQYLGEFASRFRPVNRGITQSSQLLYSWEFNDAADSPHVLRFEASFSDERLVQAALVTEPSDSFRAQVRTLQSWQSYAFAFTLVSDFVVVTLAFPSFFRALVHRRLRMRRLLSAAALAGVILLVGLAGGAWLDETRIEGARQFGSVWGRIAGFIFSQVVLACALVLFYGAGRGYLAAKDHPRWLGLEALLSRRFLLRPVGASVFHGVLCGVALAALPLLVAPAFGPAQTQLSGVAALMAPNPLSGIFQPFLLIDIVGIVLVVLPLTHWLRPAWLQAPVFVVTVGVNWLIMRSPFDDWGAPTLCASLLMALAMWLVEREYGALAALTGGATMVAVWLTAQYGVQPVAALSLRAWWVAAPLLATAAAGMVIMR
ncbi:MAG: hypothetical protein K2X03_17095 [Bryobacteraceae bacterium]|nr:hypothetical protein [Bryobacteraceae bacterium]